MPSLSRLCVLWPRFGPYHLARLEAAQQMLDPRGVEVVGLETAGHERLNQWTVDDGPVGFTRVQVFPDGVFEDVPPREMERGVARALDRIAPDAVGIMSYSYPDARAALAWCRRNRRAAVLMTDTKEDDAERVGWREAVKRAIVGEFDAALVSGTPQREYLEALGFPPESIFLGYNVVDNTFYRTRAERARRDPNSVRGLPGLDDERPFFLSVNRLLPFKNLDGLLDAYVRYRDQEEAPWRLLLVGDGPDRERLAGIVRDRRIEGVVFCGYHQSDALAAYYGRAGALVHPSRKDTWGLVVNEAMAAGLPVVVSDRIGCRQDLVDEGANGYLFDPDDTEGLARILSNIAAPDRDRGALGRRSLEIIAAFDLDRFVTGLYEAAVAGLRRCSRPAAPLPTAAFAALRVLSQRVTSFHSAEL